MQNISRSKSFAKFVLIVYYIITTVLFSLLIFESLENMYVPLLTPLWNTSIKAQRLLDTSKYIKYI